MKDSDRRRAIEDLLHERFGDVVVTDVREIRPWAVARCEVRGDIGARTVIAKWLRSNPDNFRVERAQIVTEAAALTMMNDVGPGLAPSLLAHDAEHDLLLIEDLAPRRTLHSMLSGGLSPVGISGLRTFAETMGSLHAATATARTDGPWDGGARRPIDGETANELLDRLAQLAPVSDAVRHDVDAAVAALDDPEPFEAFSNGDSGANNCLVGPDGGDARLIDFEHACRRHALLDAAALHVPGSMWMTVADPVPLGVEDAYRRAAAEGIPAVLDDDSYGHGLSAACASRALGKLLRLEKLDVRPPGHHSRPQLVTTVERAVQTMQRWTSFPAATEWLSELAVALRRRWPDADLTFPDDYTLREPFDPDH